MSRQTAPSLTDRVRTTIERRSLLRQGDAVLVAVSGGPDSLALLHILHELSGEWELRLIVAHLNHGIRPGAAEEDAAFVAATASQLGIPCLVEVCDVPALARARHQSLEEAGRAARYEFFGRAAAARDCDRIATGHTADDRVETVLLNLVRGTGIDGLAGFPARRPLAPGSPGREVVRPLIDCWREEVLAYCRERGLAPRWDATNEAREAARNRIRHELLPWLERELSPAVKPRLLRLAELAEEESALLRGLARELLKRVALPDGAAALRLRAPDLAAAPAPLGRRALREALRELGVVPGRVDRHAIEDLLRLARGDLHTGITLAGSGVRVARTGDVLTLQLPTSGRAPVSIPERALPVPGHVQIPELQCRIAVTLGPPPASWRTDPAREALLDADRLRAPLVVRAPAPGDRIVPLGMQGHRKVSDLLRDRGIPLDQRRTVLVVADAERIVWVTGGSISEEVKVTAETTRVARLTLRRANQSDGGALRS